MCSIIREMKGIPITPKNKLKSLRMVETGFTTLQTSKSGMRTQLTAEIIINRISRYTGTYGRMGRG